MNNLELKLISPDKEYYNGNVDMVVIPGEEGDFSAMKEHAPIITFLRPGMIEVFNEDKLESSYFVGGGFVKILDNKCLVLVDYIKSKSDLDKKETEQEINIINEKIEHEKNVNLLEKLKLKKKILQEEHQIPTK